MISFRSSKKRKSTYHQLSNFHESTKINEKRESQNLGLEIMKIISPKKTYFSKKSKKKKTIIKNSLGKNTLF